jgi:hypothetical protein
MGMSADFEQAVRKIFRIEKRHDRPIDALLMIFTVSMSAD